MKLRTIIACMSFALCQGDVVNSATALHIEKALLTDALLVPPPLTRKDSARVVDFPFPETLCAGASLGALDGRGQRLGKMLQVLRQRIMERERFLMPCSQNLAPGSLGPLLQNLV
jgi:hypothetical protein